MRRMILMLMLPLQLVANDHASCQLVRMADIGWTDVTSTTAVTSELLKALHYEPKVSMLSMPVTFSGLKNHDLDVFLGNWMPTEEADIRPYLREGSVVQLERNLEGARFTLAMPAYVYEAGLRSFSDIQKYAGQLKKQIYGIESGNDGNRLILKMISDGAFGLKDWELVESSEQAMLVAVKQAVARRDWIVFLGWAPHPMNLAVDMRYLEGGDAYFGPKMGDSSVYTVTRSRFADDCPQLSETLKHFHFTVAMENEIMSLILVDHMEPEKAAQKWLQAHVAIARDWLKDSKTFEGDSGKAALDQYFLRRDHSVDFMSKRIPIGNWIESATTYLLEHFSKQFRYFSTSLESVMQDMIHLALYVPPPLLILLLSALAWGLHGSVALSILLILGLMVIVNLGLWIETIQTLVLVSFASLTAMLIGVPLGILASRRTWIYALLRPMLDLMQTIPTFVYLIPTLMLFGLGLVPGLISTIIFAIAPPIRLTYLGIQSIPRDWVEAVDAFGATPLQRLFKVEIPAAWSSIVAGLTQCIMLSLSMVVIAALVGAEGLGTPVVRALNTVNIRQGFEAGLAIVIVAVLLDRVLTPRGKNHESH